MPVLLILLLSVIGFAVWGGPSDPDVEFRGVQIAGCLALYLSWCFCVLSWGHVLAQRLLPARTTGLFGALLFGTIGASLTGMAFAHQGLLGGNFRWVLLSLALAGPLLELARPGKTIFTLLRESLVRELREPLPVRAVTALLVFLVLARVARASYIYAHSDPMMYHLLGPRLWWQAGGFYLPTEAPVIMSCSYWEYLSVWGNALFSGERGLGLIEGQLFGQWTHALFGFGGTAFALYAFLKGRAWNELWLKLAVLSGLSSMSLKDFSLTAKNDWGSIFWALSGGALLYGLPTVLASEGAAAILGAFVLGIAFAAKWVVFFYLVPVLLLWPALEARKKGLQGAAGTVSLYFGAFALGCAPIFLRNALQTGNPVFPWLNSVFASPWLGPSGSAAPETNLPLFGTGTFLVLAKLKIILHESPLNRALLLLPLAALFSSEVRRLRVFWFLCAVSVALFIFRPVRGQLQFRWLNAELPMLGAIAMFTIAALLDRLKGKAQLLKWGLVVCLTLFLFQKNMVWEEWSELFSGPSPTVLIRSTAGGFIGGEAKAWLRMNAKEGETVVSTADNQSYYISHLKLLSLFHDAWLDRSAYFLRDPRDLLTLMRNRGGKFLLDTLYWETYSEKKAVFWGDYSLRLAPLIMKNAEAVVFWGDLSVIVDLERLEEIVFAACPSVRRPNARDPGVPQ